MSGEIVTAERAFATPTAVGRRSDVANGTRRIAAVPIDAPDWKGFVRSQAGALGYHDPAWSLMLAECYGDRKSVV